MNHRARLFFLRQSLAKAETHLGLLGWQQADFDSETQRQVDALHNIEREQARVTNRSAELARELNALGAERSEGRTKYEQQRSVLETELTAVREPLPDLQRRIAAVHANTPDVERKTAQLDKELRDIETLSNRLLLIQPQPPETRSEILRLRDRSLAIQNERNDVKTQHARSLGDVQHLEQQHDVIKGKSADLERRIRELREAFESVDGPLAEKEQAREEEKEKAEAEANQLERAKTDPYREIGRVLADHQISPMNQPEALSHALELRDQILDRESAVVALRHESELADRMEKRISLALWATILAAVGLVFAAWL